MGCCAHTELILAVWLSLLAISAAGDLHTWWDPVFGVNTTKGLVYGFGTYGCHNLSESSSCQTNHTPLPHSGGRHRGILTLDMFTPTPLGSGPPVPVLKPAVILIHGGSYVNGESYSDNMPHSARWFASRGWVAVSINYRVRGQSGLIPSGFPSGLGYTPKWPTHTVNGSRLKYGWLPSFSMIYPAVRDSKAAVRWLRVHAAELGIDRSVIVAYGSSAGACSAISLGTNIEPDFKNDHGLSPDPTLNSTSPWVSSSVAAVVSHWGALHGIEALEQHDNQSRVTQSFAPTIAFHGGSDYAVSPLEERTLCDRLSPLGVPCDYHALTGYGHDPTFACRCCATNCSKTAILDCSGDAFEKVKDGCELRLPTNRTLDEEALIFLSTHLPNLDIVNHSNFQWM